MTTGTPLMDGHPGVEQDLPRMVEVRQRFDRTQVDDVAAATAATLASLPVDIRPGMSVAVAVGSRGIDQLATVVRATITHLREHGAEPFVVPAMGSHGGATAEGQVEVLAGYGVTEEGVGAPVRATMDVVHVGTTPSGTNVFCDAYAAAADGIVVVNRVKPHTDFKARHESGLVKMLAIGIGKQQGAAEYHERGFALFGELLPQVATVMIERLPVLFGVATVENAYDHVRRVEAVPAERIVEREAELLVEAKAAMGSILVGGLDLLVVDVLGKNISGAGMDPNITGRSVVGLPGFPEGVTRRICCLGVTEESHGNATGMGAADVISKRLLDAVNFDHVWMNGITSRAVEGSRVPMLGRTDEAAIQIATAACMGVGPTGPRVVHLRSTLHLETIEVSENLLEEVRAHPDLEVVGEPRDWEFDAAGTLRSRL